MPPKRNPNKNKKKLKTQRERLAKMQEEREKKMEKLMEQMAATREKAERNLKKFRKMKLQIQIDEDRKKNKKFEDLKVASKIAEALNKKDKGDDDFADDAIALLQQLQPMTEEKEEEGISIGMLESALRKGKKKSKSRKEKKNLLMKGKLKVWGDNPPSDLNFDGKLRRHGKGGRRTRKKRGGGTTSPIDDGGLGRFVERVSPPTIVDRFVVLREHYRDRHNIFLNTIFNDIWANKNRTLFNKLKKKAGTNDETVINLMKHEFTIANSMLVQQMDRLVNDFRASIAIDLPPKKYIFRQTTLIDCFDTAKNRDYIARLLDGLNNNHILFFLYVLKFLQILIGKKRSDTKLNKDGDYEIDPIDNFALLAITISYYRLYRTIQRRDVPQVYNDVCNTILQIHKDDLINKRFIGWQKGGRKKTRKRRNKRKNRKKTRK